MEFKRSTTSMAIALMALSLISMTSIQQDAFAQSAGMSITATTEKSGNMITVTGIGSLHIVICRHQQNVAGRCRESFRGQRVPVAHGSLAL